MNTGEDPLLNDRIRLRRSFFAAVGFTTTLWIIKLLELMLHLDLFRYGIYPFRSDGLTGIFLAPLIHGSLYHLFTNSGPLIILGTAMLYAYPRSARIALPVIYLGSGLGVWLFGRHAYHFGASGLTFGVMFYILSLGILRWDARTIALSMVVFLLYGSMIWGIFPTDPSVSFEAHLSGAVTGIAMAVTLKNLDPRPHKSYSWEESPEGVQIGDDEQNS